MPGTISNTAQKWRKRRNQKGWLSRGYWNAVYFLGRVFSFGKWNPFKTTDIAFNNTIVLPPLPIKFDETTEIKDQPTSLSVLEQLPRETLEIISGFMGKKELGRICQTSSTMNKLFQPFLDKAKLLSYVQEANYIEAEKMVTANPRLMFQHVSYEKPDGSDEIISPLKFAFKVYDTYMWKMFYEKIKNNTKYLNDFTQQAFEQEEHITLEPLSMAYKKFIENYAKCLKNNLMLGSVTDDWLNIGKRQRELPRHILKEFVGKGSFQSHINKIDVKNFPDQLDIPLFNRFNRMFGESDKQSLFPLLPNTGLGYQYVLVLVNRFSSNWISNVVACDTDLGLGLDICTELKQVQELVIFDHIYNEKKNNFETFLAQLKPTSEMTSMVKRRTK